MPKPILGKVETTEIDATVTLKIRAKYLREPKFARIKAFETGQFKFGILTDQVALEVENGNDFVVINFSTSTLPNARKITGAEELEITVENGDGNEGSTVYP